MELLEGLTLRHWSAGKTLEIETVLDLGIQIAHQHSQEPPHSTSLCGSSILFPNTGG
jgi:hypothetical protein